MLSNAVIILDQKLHVLCFKRAYQIKHRVLCSKILHLFVLTLKWSRYWALPLVVKGGPYGPSGGPVKLDSMWQHRLTRLVRDRYMYSIRITV